MQANNLSVIVITLGLIAHIVVAYLYFDQKPGVAAAYGVGCFLVAVVITGIATAIIYYGSQKSSKAANLALAITFIVVSLASFNQTRLSSPKALRAAIHQIVEHANKGLPKQLDELTLFQRITYDDTAGEIRFVYEVTAQDFAFTDEAKALIKKGAFAAYQGKVPEKVQSQFKAANVRVYYTYSRGGEEHVRVQVN